MPFTTYAELQTEIGNWLARSDLTSNIPDFITLFEATACRQLRVRRTQTTTTLTPSSGTVSLPSDYLGWIRATVTSASRVDMEYLHPSYFELRVPETISSTPSFFTIVGGSLITRSSDTTGIDFAYYQKTAAVSGTLNWLFTQHPDSYLFGSLAEAEAFGVNDERMVTWKARRDEVFSEIKLLDFRERGQMSIRIAGAHP